MSEMIVNLIFGQSLIHSIGYKVPQVPAFLVCLLRWDSPLNRRYKVLSFYAFIFSDKIKSNNGSSDNYVAGT